MSEPPKAKLDANMLHWILTLRGTYLFLAGFVLWTVAQSGYLAQGGPTMTAISVLMQLFGFGSVAASHPPRIPWTLEQYNTWRINKGMPPVALDGWHVSTSTPVPLSQAMPPDEVTLVSKPPAMVPVKKEGAK